MSFKQGRRPKFSKKEAILSELDSEDELGSMLNRSRSKESKSNFKEKDDLSSISFGALNNAQKKLKHSFSSSSRDSKIPQSDEDSEEGEFFDEDEQQDSSSDEDNQRHTDARSNKKKSKHAPREASAKRPVPKIRNIPGLDTKKGTTLYTDIRFDTAYGKSDLMQTRKNYAFLDDYRKTEIEEMQNLLKANQKKQLLSESEVGELNYKIQSLKSRMDTLKNRDIENKVVKDFKDKHKGNGNFYLKRSDKRKLIQKAKFDGMKSRQREKVMERKRKKRLGKEFKQMEYM